MSRAGFNLQDMIFRLGSEHSWETVENLQNMFAHPEKRKLAEEEKAMKEAAQLALPAGSSGDILHGAGAQCARRIDQGNRLGVLLSILAYPAVLLTRWV